MEDKKRMVAFAIVERLGQKNRWIRLGPTFENKDGSLNVKIESLPLDVFATGNLTINIREERPKEETG